MAGIKKPKLVGGTLSRFGITSRRSMLLKAGGVFGVAIIILLALLNIPGIKTEIEKAKCLMCHSEFSKMEASSFVHTAFAKGACQECHTSHGEEKVKITWVSYVNILTKGLIGRKETGRTTIKSFKAGDRPKEESKLVKPEKELCNDCHDGKRFNSWKKAKYKHPPYKKGACTSCHDAHASKYLAVTRNKPEELCMSCHNVRGWMGKKVLHPPFKAKRCADCHDSHASNTKAHLVLPQKQLCTSCHAQIAKLYNLTYQMEPFEKGQCTECHNPHSSSYQKLWLAGPSLKQMCFSCHDGKNGSDVKQFSDDAYQMKPYKEGKCDQCHKPHATKDPKLLLGQGNEFCYKCHREYEKNYLPIGHNKADRNKKSPADAAHGKGTCLNCHVPHGSKWTGLVYTETIELCTTCHTKYYNGKHIAHPVGLDIKDAWRGGYLRCPSCHNPMGSGISKLKRKEADDLCIQCHNSTDPAWIKGLKKK